MARPQPPPFTKAVNPFAEKGLQPPVPTPLVNSNNKCWLNSVVQALLSCPQMHHLKNVGLTLGHEPAHKWLAGLANQLNGNAFDIASVYGSPRAEASFLSDWFKKKTPIWGP
eukprot:314214_1